MPASRKLDHRQRRRIRAYAGVVGAVVIVGFVLVLLLVYGGELSTTAYIVFGAVIITAVLWAAAGVWLLLRDRRG